MAAAKDRCARCTNRAVNVATYLDEHGRQRLAVRVCDACVPGEVARGAARVVDATLTRAEFAAQGLK